MVMNTESINVNKFISVIKKILKELQQLYSHKESMLAVDRDQFYDTPEDHLNHHPRLSQIQSWLKMVKKTVYHSKTQAHNIALEKIRKLQSYFP